MPASTPESPSIILIGMPGAGKSTVGVLLAKLAGLNFTDTDLTIQVEAGATLQEIVDSRGHLALRQLEEQILLTMDLGNGVIATGGSVVYSEALMARLRSAGPLIYLRVSLEELTRRVASAPPRGIAGDAGQSFSDIFRERTPLYKKYADLVVDADNVEPQQVAIQILEQLRTKHAPH